MIDRDVVVAKIGTIHRCLERIAEARGEQGGRLYPVDVDDITAINLQRAVQAAMDLATHVVVSEGYGVPDSSAGVFTLLEERGILDPELASRLRRMVGFRNIAVHDYQSVDPAIVEAIIERHLDDLRRLGERIAETFLDRH